MSRRTAPVSNQYYSAQRPVQYYSVPNCYLMPKLFGARSSTATLKSTGFVILHKCHQQSSVSVSVLCSKRLLHVNAVYSQVPLSQRETRRTADEAISVKKGGIYVVFQPPFLSV